MSRFLTEKQTAFWVEYVRTSSACEAYRRAYDARGMSPASIYKEASRLMANPLMVRMIAGTYTIDDFGDPSPKRDWLARVYYVYALIDPRDGLPFYIGKGTGNRYAQHKREWERASEESRTKCAKLSRMTEILQGGHDIQCYIIAENLTEGVALKREGELIGEYRSSVVNKIEATVAAPERWLRDINKMVSRFKTPSQWIKTVVDEECRFPTEAEMDDYVDSFLSHLSLRKTFRQMMMVDNAGSG